ncbi:MAG: cupin domain-containing protein [Thermoplasmata archaeon]|nr:MAG: cupin domain-containing protein [Thermoplasmata archaeon]RLF51200.1 MAG: cupin domain-containing protein [Thermoplasmata archaeon]
MFIVDINDCEEIIAGDNSILKEIFNPLKDDIDVGYSLALARVKPGEITCKHKLKTSSEVYVILRGKGIMHIDDETAEVREGHIIYIPPNSVQRIKNAGNEDLVFLCIVYPPWRKEDEEILE